MSYAVDVPPTGGGPAIGRVIDGGLRDAVPEGYTGAQRLAQSSGERQHFQHHGETPFEMGMGYMFLAYAKFVTLFGHRHIGGFARDENGPSSPAVRKEVQERARILSSLFYSQIHHGPEVVLKVVKAVREHQTKIDHLAGEDFVLGWSAVVGGSLREAGMGLRPAAQAQKFDYKPDEVDVEWVNMMKAAQKPREMAKEVMRP
jgi:hypothetical protein